MSRSGLHGFVSAAVFAVGVLAFTLLPAIYALNSGAGLKANWVFVISAAALGGLGLLFFNSGLQMAEAKRVGSFFMVMLMVQLAAPAAYQLIMNGQLPLGKAVGIAAAVLAAFLLV